MLIRLSSLPSRSASFPACSRRKSIGVPEKPLPATSVRHRHGRSGPSARDADERARAAVGSRVPAERRHARHGADGHALAHRAQRRASAAADHGPARGDELRRRRRAHGGGRASAVRRDGLGVPHLHEVGRARTARPGTCARAPRRHGTQGRARALHRRRGGRRPAAGLAAHVRAGRLSLFLHRRRERRDRAARRLPLRQGAALQRRRQRAAQSVRRPRGVRSRRSSRSAIATASALRFTRRPARCGRTRTVRSAATRSTF